MPGTLTEDPLIGQILDGRYRIDSVVGRGGMGTVYRAFHVALGRYEAVKVLSLPRDTDPIVTKRFELEARAMSRLEHPNLVKVYDAGCSVEGRRYIAMELLAGRVLRKEIDMLSPRPFYPARAMGIMAQVLDGLSAAHAAGIVHRDLKPENIFLASYRDRERIKLLDFGVAKWLSADAGSLRMMVTQGLLGTPVYMAPEQVDGKAVDHRADIYATGIVLFELLTGRQAFDGQTAEAMMKRLHEPAPRLSEVDPQWSIPLLELVVARARAPTGKPLSDGHGNESGSGGRSR